MGRLKGITIVLKNKTKIGEDPFGAAIYEIEDVEVENVLVSPTDSDEMVSQLSLTGKKAVYTLAIPKGDKNNWENQIVEFFGEQWRTIGIPLEGIEEMLPLQWNKKVMVERNEIA